MTFGASGFICESLTSMAECADSTPTKSIERTCISTIERANLYTLRKLSLTVILGDFILGDEKCVVVRSLSAKYRPDRYRRDKSVKFGTELP